MISDAQFQFLLFSEGIASFVLCPQLIFNFIFSFYFYFYFFCFCDKIYII